MASISVVVGLAFGTMAESLYTKSYSRNLGPIIGAVVGLFIGVIYNVILATVREHKPNCPTMIGYGTMLGAIAGVLCSTLVHAALMFAYTETNFSNLMFGLAFGSIAGIILGWIATALIGGQQKTAQAIDG
jgi:large-conductance mechanosensitive channel